MACVSWADVPFRQHRADALFALSVSNNNIVFIGNSITNMHEWREAFANPLILNRGISGAISDEVSANLEAYIAGSPRKIFLMIGVNDLGSSGMNTPEYPFRNMKKLIQRIRKECPQSELYVQSVLPAQRSNVSSENIRVLNQLVEAYCKEINVTFINLYTLLPEVGRADAQFTFDGLHLTAKGYAVWCHAIEQYVGSPTIYPQAGAMTFDNGGLSGSLGMRTTYFSQYPVAEDDVLFIGDELIHSGEWAELLGNNHVKNRGNGWGYAQNTLSDIASAISPIFHGGQAHPAKVFLYAGTYDLNNGSVDNAAQKYQGIVSQIRTLSPQTRIYLMGVIPNAAASVNAQKYVPFNARLQEMAAADEQVEYVDTYTPFLQGDAANASYITEGYLYGAGYGLMAETLAPVVGNCTPVTMEAAKARIELNKHRNALGAAIHSALDVEYGDSMGQYSGVSATNMEAALNAAYGVLGNASADASALDAAAENVRNAAPAPADINQPKASTAGDEHWYTFCSSLRGKYYITEIGGKLVGGSNTGNRNMMWKFVRRSDNTFDIVNRETGNFMNPATAYDRQVTTTSSQPAAGWTVSYANTRGMYIVSSGTVELNQTITPQFNLAVYNWSSGETGLDRNDPGCQTTIAEAQEVPNEPVADPIGNHLTSLDDLTTGWYRVVYNGTQTENKGRFVYNGAEEYRQTNIYSYPLFLSNSDANPGEKNPVYYVRVVQDGASRYVQSVNGHWLAATATAKRTKEEAGATAFNYVAGGEDFQISQYWSYFPTLGGIIGKAGAQSYNTYRLYAVDPQAQGLQAWNVSIEQTPAGEVRDDARATISTAGAVGLTKVYNDGWFFLPAGTVPKASEISCGDLTITVDAATHTITAKRPDVEELKQAARELLNKRGAGYPKTTSPAYVSLEAAINAEPFDLARLQAARESYLAESDIELPVDGRAYRFVNKQASGSKYLLRNRPYTGVGLVSYEADSKNDGDIFICHELGEGKFMFANGLGKYLIFKGTAGDRDDNGYNGNKGILDSYDPAYCSLSISKITSGEHTDAMTSAGDFFGCVAIKGLRKNDTEGYFVIRNTASFNQANVPFYTDQFSSAFLMEEVPDYYNRVTPVAVQEHNWVPLYLPFAVTVPEGATLYTGEADDTKPAFALSEVEGEVIPAFTPVLVDAAGADELLFVPSTEAGEEVANNPFSGTIEKGSTKDASKLTLQFGLSADGAPGFYALTGEELPLGKAFLVRDAGTSASLPLTFLEPTGITSLDAGVKVPVAIYDLQGRRLPCVPAQGVYIINGTKRMSK